MNFDMESGGERVLQAPPGRFRQAGEGEDPQNPSQDPEELTEQDFSREAEPQGP